MTWRDHTRPNRTSLFVNINNNIVFISPFHFSVMEPSQICKIAKAIEPRCFYSLGIYLGIKATEILLIQTKHNGINEGSISELLNSWMEQKSDHENIGMLLALHLQNIGLYLPAKNLFGTTRIGIIPSTKKKVDTYSTWIISYTISLDDQCHISYERRISRL